MTTENTLPKLRSDLIVHTSPETPDRFLLENLESGRAFTFKEREFTIVALLDGESSLKTVAEMASLETGATLSVSTVTKFVERLNQLGLLEQSDGQEQTGSVSQPRKRDYIEIKLEHWLRLLRFVAGLFFSSLSGYLLFAVTLLAFLAEAFFWHDTYAQDIQHYFSWPTMPLAFIVIYACLPVIMFVHEMGHMLAALHFLQRLYPIRVYGYRRVHVSLPPAAVWSLRSRTSRVMIALAGLYFQTLLLLLVGAIWGYMGRQPVIGLICSALSIPLIGSFLLTVIPAYPGLLENKNDGYFTLSYLLNIPNLAARTQSYLLCKKDSTYRPPAWLTQLTRFQRAGLVCYVSVLHWSGLALILGVFCSVSIWVFWPIHTTGVVVIIIIAFWLSWPYLSLLRGIISTKKLLGMVQNEREPM